MDDLTVSSYEEVEGNRLLVSVTCDASSNKYQNHLNWLKEGKLIGNSDGETRLDFEKIIGCIELDIFLSFRRSCVAS